MNVRIADNTAGQDGLHVDRMISDIKQSESQIRLLAGDAVDLGSLTTDTLGTYGFDNVFASDEFVTAIQQYNLFRIRAIKFDIYDINPNQPVFNAWGVWHDNYETTIPAYTRANVTDLPDSRVISGGTGQTTLYWVAHGTAEMQFQAASTAGSPAQRFGGLKFFIGGSTAAVSKFELVVHVLIDFRGRR